MDSDTPTISMEQVAQIIYMSTAQVAQIIYTLLDSKHTTNTSVNPLSAACGLFTWDPHVQAYRVNDWHGYLKLRLQHGV